MLGLYACQHRNASPQGVGLEPGIAENEAGGRYVTCAPAIGRSDCHLEIGEGRVWPVNAVYSPPRTGLVRRSVDCDGTMPRDLESALPNI